MTRRRHILISVGTIVVLEVLSHMDYQPLILALAAFIGALATAIPSIILLASHGDTLRRVETSTNGSLLAMRAEVARLNALLLERADAAPQVVEEARP